MTAIVEAIDAYMEATYGSYSHTFWGFCELSHRTTETQTQPIPAKITLTHKRTQVSLDDKKQLVTWIRIVENSSQGNEIEGNDWDFGLNNNSVQTTTLRMIVAHKIELGENLIYQIAHSFPDLLSVNGCQIVSINRADLNIDPDHENIYLTELGAGQYERHRFPWNLYALDIPVDYILKPECV